MGVGGGWGVVRLQFPLTSSSFTSQKELPFCFPELPFSFAEVSSFYLLCTSFSKNAFFQLIVASPRPAQSCSKLLRDNCLAVVLFPLGTIYWPIYWIYLNLSHSIWEGKLNPHSNRYQIKWFKVTSIPDNVKNSKWSTGAWLFVYSNFSHHDSFENAVSEHSWNSTIF